MTDRFWLFIFTTCATLGVMLGFVNVEPPVSAGALFMSGSVFGIGLCGLVLFALIQINERNK